MLLVELVSGPAVVEAHHDGGDGDVVIDCDNFTCSYMYAVTTIMMMPVR
jgi:hypothetical protein